MPENFELYIPTTALDRTYIQNVWRMLSTDKNNVQGIIMPTGDADIIFNFSDRIEYSLENTSKKTTLPSVFICGLRLNPIRNKIAGKEYLIGIQFNSLALKMLFGYAAKEFTNKIYDGRLIDSSLNELSEKLYSQKEFKLQAESIITWFRNKVQKNGCQLSMHRMQQIVYNKKGIDLTVKKLSTEVFLSPRQLQRHANDWLGMGPDDYMMYHKFLHSVLLIQHKRLSLTEVALKSGYYDQSHFIKEFRHYAEMTPGQYRSILFTEKGDIC